jgi:hypothetical protein
MPHRRQKKNSPASLEVNGSSEWEEFADPATGDTYYQNILTLETTWDKPEGLIQEEEKQHEQHTLLERAIHDCQATIKLPLEAREKSALLEQLNKEVELLDSDIEATLAKHRQHIESSRNSITQWVYNGQKNRLPEARRKIHEHIEKTVYCILMKHTKRQVNRKKAAALQRDNCIEELKSAGEEYNECKGEYSEALLFRQLIITKQAVALQKPRITARNETFLEVQESIEKEYIKLRSKTYAQALVTATCQIMGFKTIEEDEARAYVEDKVEELEATMLAKPNEFEALLKNAEQALASAAKRQTRAITAAEKFCADDNAFVMDISSSPIASAVACRAAFISSLDAVAAAELSNDAVKELHENRKKYRAAEFCPHHRQCSRDGRTRTCSQRQQCHIGSCPSAPRGSKCGKDYYSFSCGCSFNDQSLRLAYEKVERFVSRIPPASVHTFRSRYPEYAGFEHMFTQQGFWRVRLPKAGGVIKPDQHCEQENFLC